ncbi:unnamed protein product [Schistosoma margrebowiei]|uniref:PSI domain-containing protein n=1 Tax=Schistosoma margrebowiei TaxID=48269 RepID=A0AA84ZAF4_9TREM|nr:unnamed protein product [Schistosoma margrebowiei]
MSDTLYFNLLLWLCFIKLLYSNHHPTIGIINVNETDETFSQTDHYYYTELIRFNQSSPVIFDNVNKPINLSRPRCPLFKGVLGIGPGTEKPDSGNIIHTFDGENEYDEIQVKDSNEFSAVKWLRLNTQYSNDYQIKDHVQIVCVIYSNGNISIYYEKIPNEIETNSSVKLIYEPPNEDDHYRRKEILSTYLVKSGMLIEFTPILIHTLNCQATRSGTNCMEYKFCEDCTKDYTSGRKCHWCPKFNTCRHLRDIDIQTLLGKDCAVQQIGICSYSTNRMIEHVPTEESTVKHNIESTNLITLTSNRTTMKSITTENISPTQPLMNTNKLNKINESSVNDHQTTFPQVTIYQSSSRPIQITTHMIIKVTEDNPITSKQLLFSRDILQIYSITFINEVSRRLFIRLLMPFIIVTIVSSIVFFVRLFKIRHQNDMKN